MATMTEHTPGPWNVGTRGGIEGREVKVGPVFVIAIVNTTSNEEGNRLANARLIAAAPKLLALAERVAAHFDGTDAPLGEAARAIIRTATGQEGGCVRDRELLNTLQAILRVLRGNA